MRALVISPKENMEMWIKFANLCRKSGRIGLAEKSLNSLLDIEGGGGTIASFSTNMRAPPQVMYAHLKYMWATGDQQKALGHLTSFTAKMSADLPGQYPPEVPSPRQSQAARDEYTRLLARCYLKQGEWQVTLQNTWRPEKVNEILRSYMLATHYHPSWYKAWHAWALANFEVVNALSGKDSTGVDNPDISPEIITNHVVPAVKGFFRSISLSDGSSLQDTLRLLTLWFAHGGHHEVNAAVTEGFNAVSIDTWLEVIPQLIARINQPNPIVRHSVHQLLAEVGRAHPQALVYPLTVASKSNLSRRQKSASQIMDSMRSHSAKLVEQAEIVSQELIRVAVLWHELWHEGLEEASRLYFGEHNIEAMLRTLEPLHEMLERVSVTLPSLVTICAKLTIIGT